MPGAESALVEANIGAISSGANISVTVKLQQSDDDGAVDPYADIAGATTGAIANAGQNEPYLFDLNLSELKRYIRAVAIGGSSGGGLAGASFKLSDLRSAPPTQVNTAVRVGYS